MKQRTISCKWLCMLFALLLTLPAQGKDESERSKSVTVDASHLKNDAWYDMSGRRLDSKPTQPGIYLFTGKKVQIK